MRLRTRVFRVFGLLFLGLLIAYGVLFLFFGGRVAYLEHTILVDMNSGRCILRRSSFGIPLKTQEIETPFAELVDQFGLAPEPREERWQFLHARHWYIGGGMARSSGDARAFNAARGFAQTLELYEYRHLLPEDRKRELVAKMLDAMRENDYELMRSINLQLLDDLRALRD